MSYSVTLHLERLSLEEVVPLVRRFCATSIVKSTDVDWEVWTTYCCGMDVSVYEPQGLVPDQGIQFDRYRTIVSFWASHVSKVKEQMMHSVAEALGEWIGRETSNSWMVVAEMGVLIACSNPQRSDDK